MTYQILTEPPNEINNKTKKQQLCFKLNVCT